MELLEVGVFTRLWMLFVLVTTVSGQETISGFTGQAVLLPCIYGQPKELPLRTSVFWRGKDDINLYDILHYEPDYSSQDPSFRDRTQSFPQLYRKGNFSIVLQKARLSDSGRYTCFIPSVGFQHRIELAITAGERIGSESESDDGKRSGSAAVRPNHLLLLLLLIRQTVLLYGK